MQFVMYADVYGFSALVKENLKNTEDRVVNFQRIFFGIVQDQAALFSNIEIRPYTISDNFFLVFSIDDTLDSFEHTKCWDHFLHTCALLYEESIKLDLPLRGCIAAGEIIAKDNILLGAPVIFAATIEKNISLPLVFLPQETIDYLSKNSKIDAKRINEHLESILDFPYLNGLISCEPILVGGKEEIITLAHEKYASYKSSIKTAGPALVWKQLIEILKRV